MLLRSLSLFMLKSLCLTATAFIVCAIASGCRDTSSPAKTLIGHWVTINYKGDEIHYCYLPSGEVIYYNKTTDNIEKLPYRVVRESPKARIVTVEIGYNGSTDTLKIARDNRSADVTSHSELVGDLTDSVREAVKAFTGSLPPEETDKWKYISSNPNSCR